MGLRLRATSAMAAMPSARYAARSKVTATAARAVNEVTPASIATLRGKAPDAMAPTSSESSNTALWPKVSREVKKPIAP